jgi:hypothetical protein
MDLEENIGRAERSGSVCGEAMQGEMEADTLKMDKGRD